VSTPKFKIGVPLKTFCMFTDVAVKPLISIKSSFTVIGEHPYKLDVYTPVHAVNVSIVPVDALKPGSNNQIPSEFVNILESTPSLTPSSNVIPPPIAVK